MSEIISQTYDLDYFSGAQASVYIGDVFVDELNHLRFVKQQRKFPIYSYGDQFYKTIAPGPVIVQGSFTVNFKDTGYMLAILARLGKEPRANKELRSIYNAMYASDPNQTTERIRQFSNAIQGSEFTSPEERLQILSILSSLSAKKLTEVERSSNRGLVSQRANTVFDETLAEQMRENIWGKPSKGAFSDEVTAADLVTVDNNAFDNDTRFNINIRYGLSGTDFEGNSYRTPSFTAKQIKRVSITNIHHEFDSSGMPIQETYEFIARDAI